MYLKVEDSVLECLSSFDPCSSRNHEPFPYMPDRCPACEYLTNDRNDLYDLDHDIWYGTEFNMTTRYVSPYGCGTRIPIWMNGLHLHFK
ncbi:hypothetical protein CHS0354_002919 [Potamilus streckersoni]|uniref:Uncharacterized protein n=1 Tax=Potamilus streckersoni TaxID=2493646 RepID=A0AAE0TCC3_9BIVA|nr:hypothetical protein CHS0354_002919 [Potamilus streckersoni]